MVQRIALLSLLMIFSSLASAQYWKYQVEQTSGKQKVKTLKFKSGMPMDVGKFISGNDSLNESIYYKGVFNAGNSDSLMLRVSSVKFESYSKRGPTLVRTVPVSLSGIPFGPDTLIRFAKQDVDYLSYMKRKGTGFDPTLPLLLGSLAIIMVSPLICYDFKAHEINTSRLPYWSIGGTAGFICGFSSIFINANRNHQAYQFRSAWPSQHREQWKFK